MKAVEKPGFCVLLSAPTGSGKSTRVPGMLLEAGWEERGTIIVVQPRRLAARLLAGYVARQFPCRLGQEVGYTVRFDSRRGAATRILFVTDGILERRLTEDPELKGVSAVIFDEVHERRLSGDLCLARVLELQNSTRPDIAINSIYPYVSMHAKLSLGEYAFDYNPDVVVINLGTNDWAENQATYQNDALGLLKLVRAKNPKATIVWAYGMMDQDHPSINWIRTTVNQFAATDGNTYFIAMAENTNGLWAHPDKAAHIQAGNTLAAFIKNIKGW